MRRRLTRRKKNKRNKQIIMVSTICLLVVMGVGYAAFSTQLSLKAKGNIKEKKAADMLKENVVDSGDGLYKDIYEDGKYTYKGANPNNYITFNNEMWRIISIVSDNTVKIIKDDVLTERAWDTSSGCSVAYNEIKKDKNKITVDNIIYLAPEPSSGGCDDWSAPATLNTYLNSEYLSSLSDTNKIVSHNWDIGGIADLNNDLLAQINDEKSKMWEGKVGLITVSEYLRTNSNKESCGTVRLNNNNYSNCKNTTWMYIYNMTATLTPYYDSRANYLYIRIIYQSGVVSTASVYEYKLIRPALYLSSDVTLSGSGTQSDPYVVN